MGTSRYQLIENLNTSKNSPHGEGRRGCTDEVAGMRRLRKQLEFGQATGQASAEGVDQEWAGSGVLVMQDSAFEVEKDGTRGKAPGPPSSDPTEVNTTDQELSDTDHRSALEALHQGSEI
jgi:hypothetical protein